MRRVAPLLALLVLVGCSNPTELMLVVKAGSGLTIGTGGQVDEIRVRAQPANDPPTTFFFDKYVSLCTVEGPDCRPTKFATEDYDGSLTLPIHFLLQPGDKGINDDIRVWVDGLSNNKVVLASGLRFQFSKGHRLWLELPLFPQCIGMLTCQEEDLACGSDTDCVAYVPTKVDSSDDAGQSPTADLSISDLTPNMDLESAPGDSAFASPDFAAPPDMALPCGTPEAACCANGACNTDMGLTCANSTQCIPTGAQCGQLGLSCCDMGQACSASTACVDTKCQTCGGDGGPCCTTGNACSDPLYSCQTDSTGQKSCQPCGAENGPCCGTACPSASDACDPTSNTCKPCGSLNEQCCVNKKCTDQAVPTICNGVGMCAQCDPQTQCCSTQTAQFASPKLGKTPPICTAGSSG